MRRFGMAAVMVTVLLAGSPSQAETNTETKRYTGSLLVAALLINSGNPTVGWISNARFDGEGTPIAVAIDDEVTRGRVAFWASQNFDGDGLWGETGEPSQFSCAEPGSQTMLDRSVVPFVPGRVGIAIMSSKDAPEELIDCYDGRGVHGSITLTRTTG